MLLFRMLSVPSIQLSCSLCVSLPSPLFLTCTSFLRWPSPSPTSSSRSLSSLPLSGLLGSYSDIPGAAVLISAFNNEWKSMIRQSLQKHVAHSAQGRDSGSCQEGMMASTDRCVEGSWAHAAHVHTKGSTCVLVKDSQTNILQSREGKENELP